MCLFLLTSNAKRFPADRGYPIDAGEDAFLRAPFLDPSQYYGGEQCGPK